MSDDDDGAVHEFEDWPRSPETISSRNKDDPSAGKAVEDNWTSYVMDGRSVYSRFLSKNTVLFSSK